jgi:hypothetical protein
MSRRRGKSAPTPPDHSRRGAGLNPVQKPIRIYYETLQAYSARGVRHEGALETAFQRLLADTATRVGWTLIPKQRVRLNGESIYPDGTLRDVFNLPRGYWEAKDTDDDLNVEIKKKVDKGWPAGASVLGSMSASPSSLFGREGSKRRAAVGGRLKGRLGAPDVGRRGVSVGQCPGGRRAGRARTAWRGRPRKAPSRLLNG